MSVKKGIRADKTYLFPHCKGDNPVLGAKILSDGRESLFLDYYFGYADGVTKKISRRRESLKLYLSVSPKTTEERARNRDTLELAKRIRFEREQVLKYNMLGYRLKRADDINFLDYFRNYIDRYTRKDIRCLKLAFSRFCDFIADDPVYSRCRGFVSPNLVTKDMVIAFTEYLKGRSRGEGAHSIYSRFKKVIRHAVEAGVLQKDPCAGVSLKSDERMLKKDILSQEEIRRLAAVRCEDIDPDICRAFIFCLYTGMRYCDMKDLTFANVDRSNRLLRFEQDKTAGHSSSSGVVIPLNDSLLRLIGQPSGQTSMDQRIFRLPSYSTSLKAIKKWVRLAGIDKHISWHCARHSFAVNILNNGANIKTVASLLGHSSLRHTEKYTRAIDSLKQQAIDSLPDLDL